MERQTSHRCSVGSMLGAVALVVLSNSTLLAQVPGRWVGTTSRGGHMEFLVNPDNTVSNYQSDSLVTCESGGQYQGGFSSFGPFEIVDGNFEGGSPPREPGSFSISFKGAFSSETEAAGSHSLILAAFRILKDGFTSQICEDDADWTAMWQEPAPPQPSTGPRFVPGDEMTTYSDGKLSFQFVKKAVAPK